MIIHEIGSNGMQTSLVCDSCRSIIRKLETFSSPSANIVALCERCKTSATKNQRNLGRTITSLFHRMEQSLDEDVLDPNYPIEMVDEELRELGADPEAIRERGRKLAEHLLGKEHDQ